MNTMTYRGYTARVAYSEEDGCFVGHIAGIRDVIGGRSGSYEKVLRKAKEAALQDMAEQAQELGAHAVVGIDLDYETIQIKEGGDMLMVTATGTAVLVD